MTLGTILLIILILILVGAIPSWGYSRSWGYGPSGIVGVLLIVVIVLLAVQMAIIPRLRRPVLVLGRQRQLSARLLAGRIAETADGMSASQVLARPEEQMCARCPVRTSCPTHHEGGTLQ